MDLSLDPISYNSFTTFGDLLKYLRRRERLTQLELSIAVGYSESQITRLEKNQRLPDLTAIKALFIPALHLKDEPQLTVRFFGVSPNGTAGGCPHAGDASLQRAVVLRRAGCRAVLRTRGAHCPARRTYHGSR